MDTDWESRATALWRSFDDHSAQEFVAQIDRLVAELPPGDPVGLYERGSAQDSTGHPAEAVELYRAALAAGLDGSRRRQCVIQLASSQRSLGYADEAVTLLTTELAVGSDVLDGAVRAFLALALVDVGREREAVAVSLTALSHYLPRYNRSLARYAEKLVHGV